MKNTRFNLMIKHIYLELIFMIATIFPVMFVYVSGISYLDIFFWIALAILTVLNIIDYRNDCRKDTIYFSKLQPNAILPSKRAEDGGYDIYPYFYSFKVIQPHETIMIGTGIASAFDKKYVAVLQERGSTGTKGIGQRSGVIDSGYRGEWNVPITNHNDKPLVIKGINYDEEYFKQANPDLNLDECIVYPENKAICQMLLLEVPEVKVEEVNYARLVEFKSERGDGKLGSSGK